MEEGSDEMKSRRKLTSQASKVEHYLTGGDTTKTDLANPSSKREDCRVHWGLLSLNVTEKDLMTAEWCLSCV